MTIMEGRQKHSRCGGGVPERKEAAKALDCCVVYSPAAFEVQRLMEPWMGVTRGK